ncbi:hypothetical protein [Haliea sp.]|uniref:hypothetical protein n=1 Tax=Haliea sp. TaxID=1932666 RepID=UPI00258028DA|nr:hypothetical protein [Haliea sp.]
MSLTDKNKYIVDKVAELSDISGYRFFVEDLLLKTQGIDALKEFDVAGLLDQFLRKQSKVGGVDEAVFTQFILNLPLFQYIVVCASSKREWMIWKESFSSFIGDQELEDLLFVKRGDPELITKTVFDWMIRLCDSSDAYVNGLKHHSSIAVKH